MIEEKEMVTNEELTLDEKLQIQNSWLKLGQSSDMITDFYNQLFILYPRLRPLFKEDIRLQARKFTAHITYLINHINDWKHLQADLDELGKRHVHYEVKAEYFEYVKEALFPTMKKYMGEGWNESLEHAWNKFYLLVSNRMIASAGRIHIN